MTPSKNLNKKPNERNKSSKKTQETEKNKEIEIPFCSHKIKLKQESTDDMTQILLDLQTFT